MGLMPSQLRMNWTKQTRVSDKYPRELFSMRSTSSHLYGLRVRSIQLYMLWNLMDFEFIENRNLSYLKICSFKVEIKRKNWSEKIYFDAYVFLFQIIRIVSNKWYFFLNQDPPSGGEKMLQRRFADFWKKTQRRRRWSFKIAASSKLKQLGKKFSCNNRPRPCRSAGQSKPIPGNS